MSSPLFSDTQVAFAHKSSSDLKRNLFLLRWINRPFFLRCALTLTPLLLKWRFPFIKFLLYKTVFRQFIGGQTLEDCTATIKHLCAHRVNVILDYTAEAKQRESEFDSSSTTFIETIRYASQFPSVTFISLKPTSLTSLDFFMQLNPLLSFDDILNSQFPTKASAQLHTQYEQLCARFDPILQTAHEHNKPVMIDAEESYIQKVIDFIAHKYTRMYNRERVLVYNTFQMYRHDKLSELRRFLAQAEQQKFYLGAKVVRGAYMEKEAAYAQKHNVPSVIHSTKLATDTDYNAAIELCLRHPYARLIVATHNEQSITQAMHTLEQLPAQTRQQTCFSQLFGMGDFLSFPLAKQGYTVCKYLPFGSVDEAVPYLIRRAQENSSFEGQSEKEYRLLQQEYRRRAKAKSCCC